MRWRSRKESKGWSRNHQKAHVVSVSNSGSRDGTVLNDDVALGNTCQSSNFLREYRKYDYRQSVHTEVEANKRKYKKGGDNPGRNKPDGPQVDNLDFTLPQNGVGEFVEDNTVTVMHIKLTKYGPEWELGNDNDKVILEEVTTIEQQCIIKKLDDAGKPKKQKETVAGKQRKTAQTQEVGEEVAQEECQEVCYSPFQLQDFQRDKIQDDLLYHPRAKKKSWQTESFQQKKARELESLPGVNLTRAQEDLDQMKNYQLENYRRDKIHDDLIYHPRPRKRALDSRSFQEKKAKELGMLPKVKVKRSQEDIERMKRYQLENFQRDKIHNDLLYHPKTEMPSDRVAFETRKFEEKKKRHLEATPNVRLRGPLVGDAEETMKRFQLHSFKQDKLRDTLLYNSQTERLPNFKHDKLRDTLLYNSQTERNVTNEADIADDSFGFPMFCESGDKARLEREEYVITHHTTRPIRNPC